ncbi:MAG: hypothetical protein V3W41_22235 [Planctomycetota bacterium]
MNDRMYDDAPPTSLKDALVVIERLKSEHASASSYIMGRCDMVEGKGVTIAWRARSAFDVSMARRFSTRAAALLFAEKLLEAMK